MFPTSIAGSIRIGGPGDRVAVDHGPDVDRIEREVAARLDSAEVQVDLVGAGHIAARSDRLVEQDRQIGPDRADEPRRPEPRRHLVRVRGAELAAQRERELDLVDAVIAAHHDDLHRVAVDDHRKRLEQRAGADLQLLRDGVDRRHPGGLHLLGRVERSRQLDGLGVGAGDLEVGRVAAGERHVVLAGRARRHVLVGAGAAHHPDVGFDPVPLQPEPVEHPVIGDDVLVVGDVEALAVAVERVGVLHDELARPQHAGARAGLVALLDLEVVEDQRQVAV